MLAPPASNPASSYAEAVERARAVTALDDARIAPNAHTALLDHGVKRPWAVVLFHGFTNHPGQFVEFAPRLFELGANVYVPRMRYHGYADRMTRAIAGLRAEDLISDAYAAVDVARGLGERVAVLGISMGGLQCAFLGQFRDDVDSSVCVAPDFAILQLSRDVTDMVAWVFDRLPNFFLWWDPRVREKQRPRTAYPRFSTHALFQVQRVADAVHTAAKREHARAGRIAAVVNPFDPAVNNGVTREVVGDWRALRDDGIDWIEVTGLPANHDIIDPDNPLARTQLVYPRLIDALAIHNS